MRYKYIILIFVVCYVVGLFVGHTIKGNGSNEDTIVDPDSTVVESIIETEVDSVTSETETRDVVELVVVEHPRLHDSSYTFVIAVKNSTLNKLLYQLKDKNTRKQISTSKNGKFRNVPGVKGGTYIVSVLDEIGKSVIIEKEVSGFKLVSDEEDTDNKSVLKKQMTKETLESLINKRSRTLIGGRTPQVSKNVTIVVEGEDMNGGSYGFTNIFSLLSFGTWERVTVKSVQYDETNKINHIVLVPVLPQ